MALTLTHDEAADGAHPGPLGKTGGVFPGVASAPGVTVRVVNIAWDAAYASGGEALTAADVGLGSIFAVIPVKTATQSAFGDVDGGYSFKYDAANAKLIAYATNGTEPGAIDISADADGTFWVFGYQ